VTPPDIDRIAGLAAEVEYRFGRFIHECVNPGADARDRTGEALPRALLAEAGRIGLLGFSLPPEIGGEGRDKFEWGIVVEEVSRLSLDPGFSSVSDLNVGVAELLVGTGRADLVERYAVPMAAGLCVCPPAAYESRDPFDYATSAGETGGGWLLSGSKPFVGGALFADAFLVFAREMESGDILAFLVERGDDGVSIDPLATMGLRSMGFGSLSLDRVRLTEERLVIDADALSAFNSYLRNRRLMTAAAVVGHMRALFESCVQALDNRQRGGRGVLELPNVQRTVGEMYTALQASRALVHQALAQPGTVLTQPAVVLTEPGVHPLVDLLADPLDKTLGHRRLVARAEFGMGGHGGGDLITLVGVHAHTLRPHQGAEQA